MNTTARMRSLTLLAPLLVLLGASPAQDPGPVGVVERLHATLLEVMRRAEVLGYEGRYAALEPVVSETFDLPFMAEKAVGRSWGELQPEQRQRLVEAFVRLSVANYAARFDGYSGERFETLGQESAPLDTVLVHSTIAGPDEKVALDYRLHAVDGRWRVVDVYLKGTISELAMRRSEYSSVLRRDGFEALIAALEQKISSLASSAPVAAGS